MSGLGVAHWWDDPRYQHAATTRARGEFILTQLRERDPKRFRQLVRKLGTMRSNPPSPEALTPTQWQTILGAMGASLVEVAEVLIQLGLPWT